MTLTFAHITPVVALIAGMLILIVPRLLNYVVAIYLIIVGIVGLNSHPSLHSLIARPPRHEPLRRRPRP